ncbi:MAG: NFACT RNA binding domain-containing protein, partial [Proteobacteria bacterium]|nr:NFACT RNA binding domain-containing protein [Pseudomonadota bacterium]
GRRSNLYALDADDRVVASLRPLSETRSELAFGEPWTDPASGVPQRGRFRFESASEADLLAAIESEYQGRETARAEDDLSRRISQVLRRERKAVTRRREKLERELAEADQANELQRRGELLKSALAQVEPGAASVTVTDWDTGEPVEVPLDPALSAVQNLNALFKKSQKLIRRLAKAGGQVDAVAAQAADLEALEAEFAALAPGDAAALEAFAAREPVAAWLRPRPGAAPPSSAPAEARVPARFRDLPRRLWPRRYQGSHGMEIWVGRSDEANDVLTTRLARGKDFFLHLESSPGSHVILRTEGRSDPPSEAVLEACELAVHFSKHRRATRADVHLVPIKNVKKPKGAKPGLVYVTGGRTIHLRREEARLRRILDALIED